MTEYELKQALESNVLVRVTTSGRWGLVASIGVTNEGGFSGTVAVDVGNGCHIYDTPANLELVQCYRCGEPITWEKRWAWLMGKQGLCVECFRAQED